MSPLSGILTSVVDVSLLLVIAFLAVGGILSAALEQPWEAPSVGGDQPVDQIGESSPTVDDLERMTEELLSEQADLRLRLRIEGGSRAVKKDIDATSGELVALTEIREELEQRVAIYEERRHQADQALGEARAKSRQLSELLEDVGTRGQENKRTREKLERARQKLREIENAPPSSGADRHGVVWEQRGDSSQDGLNPLYTFVKGGKVFPVLPGPDGYYTLTRVAEVNAVVAIPRAGFHGLDPSDAIRPNSPFVRFPTSTDFRGGGKVILLVNSDSFAAFREMRRWLVEQRIRWTWWPYNGEPSIRLMPQGTPGILDPRPLGTDSTRD
jgi:hypothetical protein